jgi:3-hydroxyacyl-CoA dehydrogenase
VTARSTLFRVLDGVAVISLNAPPVNALAAPLRAALADHIRRVDTEADISAAVLRAEGALFSAGADIRELDADWQDPAPRDLCDLVEGCSKPVIAALGGQALGGGAELLLAAHYRLAEPRARVGFPEVALGVLPGAGGTQRLPRLVGPEAALKLMVSGQSVSAPDARQLGLVDGIVERDLASGAVAFARKLVADGTGPRPTRARRGGLADGRACQAQVASARREIADSPLFAPHLIVDCVEAASLLPFEAGQAFEQDAFDRCRTHPQSIALRHVFLAERRVDARLLHREGGVFLPTEPAGSAVVTRLRRALRGAAQALVETSDMPEAQIDGAMVAHGFRTGVFGHNDPGRNSATVMRRLIAALISEGAALVAEGHLDRPSDIDAMAVHGLGYPRRQGGPCRAAQTMGLLALRNDMRSWSEDNPIWAPPGMLDEAVKLAAGFDAL